MRWFKPFGIAFVPVSPVGWLLTAATTAFCANTFMIIDGHSNSVTDTLYGIFPFWVPALLALSWIADRTCGRGSESV